VKSYKFNDIKLGQTENFIKFVTSKDLDNFIKLSGDNSLIHSDKKFAKQMGFKSKVIHGAYITSLFSRLIGTKLPGKNGLLLFIDLKFSKPLYENKKIKIVGKVINKNQILKCIEVSLAAKVNKIIIAHGSCTTKLFK